MKKVIFVCMLSLSVCLSLSSQSPEAAPSPPADHRPNTTGTETKNTTTKPEHPQGSANDTPAKTPVPIVVPELQTKNTTAPNATQAASNGTSTQTNETNPAEKKNSTEPKPADAPAKPANKVDPPKEKNETKPAVPVPANADKDGKKNETTTPKGENVSPTVAPVEAKSRAFDGPSFIGGIILTLGLLAIGFMGFKYYKNQTERNYHTL